jgi:FMN-dependent oxidoreductase (nitrilotriacetate monooxygenase family)
MSRRKGQLHLTLSVQGTGYHPGSWRHPDVSNVKLHEPAYYYSLAQTAERGKFDMLLLDQTFIGERLRAAGREPGLPFEPFTLLGALASVTKHMGLGAPVSTSVIEPFAVARQLAALDHLSDGRTAWLASAVDLYEPKRRLGGPPELSFAQRKERKQEFIEVAARLWDSWEDGAVIIDRREGRYIDSDKVHLIHHTGQHFKVRGPLSIPRSPQGHPVRISISSAWDNWSGDDLDKPELVISSRPLIETAADFYQKLQKRRAVNGYPAAGVKVLTTLSPIIGATEAEARHRAAELQELADPKTGIAILSDLLDLDLTGYSLDGPLPAIPGLLEAVKASGIEAATLRELSSQIVRLTGTKVFVGTPEQLADWMEDWYQAYGSDGFHLQLPLLPGGLDEFVAQVIPVLQRRGLFRTEYTGTTLRDHLGLEVPVGVRISKEG